MQHKEFNAKFYEILESHGHIEQNGVLYYAEPAVMDALGYVYDHITEIHAPGDVKMDKMTALAAEITKALMDGKICNSY